MQKIIGCLFRQYFIDIARVYLGEIYQRDLGIRKIFTEGGADRLQGVSGEKYLNI